MTPPFSFPDPVYAWTFCTVLLAILALASFEDFKRMVIPKWVTLPMLALGLLFNVIRGGWVEPTWIGAWHGFLTSLGGFSTGFALFLAMWMLGTCGGGDVKLFAALGAWTGWLLSIYILIGTLILVVLMSVAKVAVALLGGRPQLAIQHVGTPGSRVNRRDSNGFTSSGRTPRQRLITYSFPVALSTACVLPWVFRFELRLVHEAHEPPHQTRVQVGP